MNDRARFKVKDESQKDFQTYGTGNLFFYISRFDAEKNQMELPIIWKFKDDIIDRGFTFDNLVESVVNTGNALVKTVEDVTDGWFFKTIDWTRYGDLEKLAETIRQEQIAKLQLLEEEKAKEAENKN